MLSSLFFVFFIDFHFNILLLMLGVTQGLSFIFLSKANNNITNTSNKSVICIIYKSNGLLVTLLSDIIFNIEFSIINLIGNFYIISGIYLLHYDNFRYTIIQDEENQLDESLVKNACESCESYETNIHSNKYIYYTIGSLITNSFSSILIKQLLNENILVANILFYRSTISLFLIIGYFKYIKESLCIEFIDSLRIIDKAFSYFLILFLTIITNLNNWIIFTTLYNVVNNIGYIKSLETFTIILEILTIKYIIKLDTNYNNIQFGIGCIFLGNTIILSDVYLFKRFAISNTTQTFTF